MRRAETRATRRGSRAAVLAAGLAFAAAIQPAQAQAQAQEARPALAEVMQGAVAMASVGSFLFVTKADNSAWVCAINVTSRHFAALVEGDDVVVEQTVPGALCVPATHFNNLGE